MSCRLTAGAKRDFASDSEAARGAVVRDGEVDLFDPTVLEVDAYPAAVKNVVALHAVGDLGKNVVAVTCRTVLPFHTRPRFAEHDIAHPIPRN